VNIFTCRAVLLTVLQHPPIRTDICSMEPKMRLPKVMIAVAFAASTAYAGRGRPTAPETTGIVYSPVNIWQVYHKVCGRIFVTWPGPSRERVASYHKLKSSKRHARTPVASLLTPQALPKVSWIWHRHHRRAARAQRPHCQQPWSDNHRLRRRRHRAACRAVGRGCQSRRRNSSACEELR
jgi:dipeptidyl aminopeptidase/acylaminoacyl peptidase